MAPVVCAQTSRNWSLDTLARCVCSAQCAHSLALAAAVQFGGTPEQKKLTEALLRELCTENKKVDEETFTRLVDRLASTATEDDSDDATGGVLVSASVAAMIFCCILGESTPPMWLIIPCVLLCCSVGRALARAPLSAKVFPCLV